jgi:hypothetical protein
MAGLHLQVHVKRAWWSTAALRSLYAVYWVAAHFMTQKQADAFENWCIGFVIRRGIKTSVKAK